MKVKYIDVMDSGTVGCLSNKADVGICLDDIRTYSPTVYYLDTQQAVELYEKLGQVLFDNKNSPITEEIKKCFDERTT